MTYKEALNSSILKWDHVVRGGYDKAAKDCMLCHQFIDNKCDGCPVRKDTGQSGCHGSPYEDWLDHHRLYHALLNPPLRKQKGCKECSRLAKAFRDYLKSL